MRYLSKNKMKAFISGWILPQTTAQRLLRIPHPVWLEAFMERRHLPARLLRYVWGPPPPRPPARSQGC